MTCKTCYGTGYVEIKGEDVPYGDTFVRMPDSIEPCWNCLDKKLCPQCGNALVWEDDDPENPCHVCQYIVGEPSDSELAIAWDQDGYYL